MSDQKNDVMLAMEGRFLTFYEQFVSLHPSGGEYRGKCPLHNGQRDSFAVNPQNGLWHCHSECDEGGSVFDFLMRKEGLEFSDALAAVARWSGTVSVSTVSLPTAAGSAKPSRQIAKTYDYTDEAGALLFQVVRFKPKGFAQRRPDGDKTWVYSLAGVRRLLYRLPEVIAAAAIGKPVYICEGEKDADALAALGLAATCNPMGAKKWDEGYTESLCGTGVVILPDNDPDGAAHGQIVAQALHGLVKRVRVVNLPNLPDKGDVSDWLAAGGTKEQLLALVKNTPDWPPAAKESAAQSALPEEKDNWPKASPAMFYGLAGDIMRAIEPHTEADPVAILFQTLVSYGSAIGRTAHFLAEDDQHFGNEFGVIVGVSSKGRKGTSAGRVRKLFLDADPSWAAECHKSGASSGEGLIWHVRDPIEKTVTDKKTFETRVEIEDSGVTDKRMLVTETEFASVLRVAGRDGNTLSAIMRNAWDTGDLQTMTKNSPARAKGAHISIVGHVTADELRRELSSTEAGNGFANRFLWLCVRRSKELPEGGSLDGHELDTLKARLKAAIQHGKAIELMERDEAARALWRAVYHDLSEGGPGLAGAVTSRGEAHVMRLALLYALLDGESVIRYPHLTAALALWEYVEASAKYIFGDSLGDPVADDILHALRNAKDGMTRTDFRDLFGRNQSSGRIGQALALLLKYRLARVEMKKTDGRPAEQWYATKQETKNE